MSENPQLSSNIVGSLGVIGFCGWLAWLPLCASNDLPQELPATDPATPADGAVPEKGTAEKSTNAGDKNVSPELPPAAPKQPPDPGLKVIPGVIPAGGSRDGGVTSTDNDLPPLPVMPGEGVPALPPDQEAAQETFPPNIEMPAEPPSDADVEVEDNPPEPDSNNGDFVNNLQRYTGASPGLGMRPTGFTNAPGGYSGMTPPMLEGFGISSSIVGTYDSNISQGYGSTSEGDQSDFYVTMGATLTYLSKSPVWTFGATYTGGYNQYFNETDLSGYTQRAGGSVNYQGGPLSATLNVGVDFGSGANRYYQAVVNQLNINYGLTARYTISPKTTVTGNISQQIVSASDVADGSNSADTGSFDLGASALWRYSPLTEFGPGIRYTSRTGSSQQDRTSIGPTLTVNYHLSSKITLNSRVGVDFSKIADTSADPMFSGSVAMNYKASELWGMNVSFYRDTEADPSVAGDFSEITSLRVGCTRKIRRASLNMGVGYETNATQTNSNTITQRPERNYFTMDAAIGMPVFTDAYYASIFTRYNDQSGDPTNTWNSFQVGFGISRSF